MKRGIVFFVTGIALIHLKFLKERTTSHLVEKLSISDLVKIQNAKGLYEHGTGDLSLQNTVLVTAANSGFADFYMNWAAKSRRLGLKWILIAMDENMLAQEEERRVILLQGHKDINMAATSFRERDYNVLVCSKLRIVASIVLSAQVNVVFSDVDNVFIKDPFVSDSSLGAGMRSAKYDYMYQYNDKDQSKWMASSVESGNTGFYYLRANSNKRNALLALYQAALLKCSERPELDDQQLFWEHIHEIRAGTAYTNWVKNRSLRLMWKEPFKTVVHCPSEEVQDSFTLAICPLNAYEFPVGCHSDLNSSAAFHANWLHGNVEKRDKLRALELWEL